MEQQKLRAHLGAALKIAGFATPRDLRCSQCQADLPHGSFLLIENREPLCLTCAELDHLVYVPRGSPAEPRRSETQHTVRRRCLVQPKAQALRASRDPRVGGAGESAGGVPVRRGGAGPAVGAGRAAPERRR